MIPTDKLKRLQRLREVFLESKGETQPYWRDLEDLDVYDSVFGARLGEKWRAVWEEILPGKTFPAINHLVDFGCGSARASRETLKSFPNIKTIHLVDHSDFALSWSEACLQEKFPEVEVKKSSTLEGVDKNSWLLVSHVVNEMSVGEVEILKAQAKEFLGFVWVEPGTPQHSKQLVQLRENFFKEGKRKNILGPCPQGTRECPLANGKSDDWCHSFTQVQSDLHQDGEFNKAIKSLGIDNRSVPFSYLAVARNIENSSPKIMPSQGRVIGRPRVYKGFVKFLCCDGRLGLQELRFQKRESNEVFKAFKDDKIRYLNNFIVEGVDCKLPLNSFSQ